MSIISIPNIFSAGAVIVASQHNSNFSTIYSDYNGNIDNTNIVSNAGVLASKLNLATVSQDTTMTGKVLIGSAHQGDIYYDNGTQITRLTPGTSGQVLTTLGAAANPAWANSPHAVQIFVASGTFVAPTGITKVYLSMSGAGGGGGGRASGSCGGGGAGAYCINVPYTVVAGNSYTVTVNAVGTAGSAGVDGGNGGSVVFDALTIPGGSGGSSTSGGNGGAGGGPANGLNASSSVSTGAIPGGVAQFKGGNGALGSGGGGGGGASIFASGGAGGSSAVGNAGSNGSGGGGGQDNNGGVGGNGVVIVIY